MTPLEALIILSSVEGVGPQVIRKLVTAFGSPEACFARTEEEMPGFPSDLARKILEAPKHISPASVLDACAKHCVTLLHFLEPNYPENLAAIYDPPVLLYVKGSLIPEDRSAIGMVGSRRCSSYGLQTAFRFASELAEKGITVVSGLALGIDRASHEGALKAKGRTLAVLGSGVDIVYPRENQKIYEAIAETGAIVSEFPMGTEPRPYHFPKRNRIIAGLSLGVIVVEAGLRSGSLITAKMGMEEGREIYAIPGRIDNPYTSGTHRLIQDGAKLITTPDEILADLYPVLKGRMASQESDLDEQECSVLEALGEDSLAAEDLAEKLEWDPLELLQVLTKLETKKQLVKLPNGCFARSPKGDVAIPKESRF